MKSTTTKRIENLFSLSANMEGGWIKNSSRIVVLCFFSLILVGYRFGDGDQNSLIPFLYKLVDPTLYGGSEFFDLGASHISYFWHIFVPIVENEMSLEIAVFVVYVLVLFFIFKALYHLIQVFTDHEGLAYLGLITFVIPSFSFSIMGTYENYLVNRVAVLPFLIYAISYFLRNRYVLAGLLLGLAFNIHLLSATFVLAMFIPATLDQFFRKKMTVTDLVKPIALLAILSAPVILWGVQENTLDFSINWEWFDLIQRGALGHMFHLLSFDPPTIVLSLIGLSNTIVFLLIVLRAPGFLNAEVYRKLLFIMASIYLVLFVAAITASFFPFVLAIKFQLARIGKFIPMLTFPVFIAFLNHEYQSRRIEPGRAVQTILSLALFGWLAPPYMVYRSSSKWVRAAFTLVSAALLILVASWGRLNGQWKPGIYVFPERTAWHDIQIWVRGNTEKDAAFIVPVHQWDHYQADFALLSQRTPVVTLGELMTVAYHPEYLGEWQERFEAVLPGTISGFSGNFLANKMIAAENYRSNTAEEFTRISEKYEAEYLIIEKPQSLDFELMYENSEYVLYRINH